MQNCKNDIAALLESKSMYLQQLSQVQYFGGKGGV